MFGDFDLDLGDETTKIFVRCNGQEGAPKEVRLPPKSKLADLFEKAAKVLDIDAPQRAFYSNGVELTDVDNLEDDEVIFISCGEPFKGGTTKHGAGSQIVGNYILHEKLGQGGFGSVMKGVHSETGEVAAVKFVLKSSFKQISDLQRVYQEIQALRALQHPNVIKIFDVADHPENVCFIMEFCPGGELRAYVERQGFLSEDESRKFFKEISRAIHYVHSKKIIHRDLKLENILLDAQNRCKIVDFGLSESVSGKERTVTDAGTEAYLAPEVYNGSSGNADPYKIDVWGLGVILYALAHGKLPFSRPDVETCQRLVADGGPNYREEMSQAYRRLTTSMLIPSPEKRASMDMISLDPWVTKHRFANFDQGEDEDISFMAAEDSMVFGGDSLPATRVASMSTAGAGAHDHPDGHHGSGGGGHGAGGGGMDPVQAAHSFISETNSESGGQEVAGGSRPSHRTSASARPAAAAAAAIIGRAVPGRGGTATGGKRQPAASGKGDVAGGAAADAANATRRRAPSQGPLSPSPPRGPVAQAGATVAGAGPPGGGEKSRGGTGARGERTDTKPARRGAGD